MNTKSFKQFCLWVSYKNEYTQVSELIIYLERKDFFMLQMTGRYDVE